jgi:hypothetical protein
MIDPMTAMMLVNAGLSVAQGVQGFAQQKKANEELKKLSRPDMVIPEEAKRALGISQMIASDRNQGLEEIEAGLDAGVANSIGQINRQGGSLADRLAAIAGVTADANSQKRAARFQAEQQNIGNLQNYQQALGQMANEQRMIQQDQLNKYGQQVQSLQGMAGAGQQNMMQGLQGLAGTASQGLSYKGQMNMMDKQYQNDLNLINAQNGIGVTKAAPNTNMLQGVNTSNTADIEKLMADPNTLNMLNTAMSRGVPGKNLQLEEMMKNPQMASMLLSMMSK